MLGSSLIISILSGHLSHHVYLAHVGCSGLCVHESWAAGAHCGRSRIGELLTTTRVATLNIAAVVWGAEVVRRRVGDLWVISRIEAPTTTLRTAIAAAAWASGQTLIADIAVDRLGRATSHMFLWGSELHVSHSTRKTLGGVSMDINHKSKDGEGLSLRLDRWDHRAFVQTDTRCPDPGKSREDVHR